MIKVTNVWGESIICYVTFNHIKKAREQEGKHKEATTCSDSGNP